MKSRLSISAPNSIPTGLRWLESLLIGPPPSLTQPDGRRLARLSAISVLIALGAVAIERLFAGNVPAGALGLLVIAYGLCRTRYYAWGMAMLIGTLSLPSYLAVTRLPDYTPGTVGAPLVWLALPIVLSSLYFSARVTALICGMMLAGLMSLPWLVAGLEWRDLGTALGLVGTLSGLVLVVMSQRDLLEQDRRKALRVSEERLRFGLESARTGIWEWEIATNAVVWSHNVAHMFGLTPGEFSGQYEEYLKLIHPADVSEVQRAITDALAGTLEPYSVEHRIVLRDGSIRWLDGKGNVFRDARGQPVRMAGTVMDITDRKQSEEAARQSREQFSSAFEHAPIGMALVHPDHHIMQANRALGQMLGYSAAELIGRYFRDLTHPEDVADSVESNRRLFEGELDHYRFEKRYLHRQGHVIWALLGVSMVRAADGKPHYAIAQIQDISERKQAEEKLQRLNEELEERVERRTAELASANKELEAFSYSVSHDLRAPLRGIDGFSRILLERHAAQLDETGQHHLRRVRENAQRMGDLIDDLLEFSRLSRLPLSKQAVDPASLVREALTELQLTLLSRCLNVAIAELPHCHADPSLLRQVFVNLLGNAIKYSAGREVAEIEVGVQYMDGAAVYFIRDNGVGFDMQYADKLFGVFQRSHSENEFEGAGVGLAIVKRIIERHGGRIWAEAEVEKGATFFFTMPVS